MSEAEMLLQVTKYLHDCTESARHEEKEQALSSFEEMLTWWQDVTLCTKIQIPKRETGEKWLGLFRDQEWSDAMEKFVETVPGHKAWGISLASKLRRSEYSDVSDPSICGGSIGSDGVLTLILTQIWLGLIDQTNAFFGTLFSSEAKKLVLDTDLKLITSLGFPRQPEDLRNLFFPRQFEYYQVNPRANDFMLENTDLYQRFGNRQRMRFVLGEGFRFRREKFLENLSDTQYHKVYESLSSPEGAALRVWTWDDLKRQVELVTPIAEHILDHVCFWYKEMYEPEKRVRGKTEDGFAWARKIYETFFEDVTVEEAGGGNTEGTLGIQAEEVVYEDMEGPRDVETEEILNGNSDGTTDVEAEEFDGAADVDTEGTTDVEAEEVEEAEGDGSFQLEPDEEEAEINGQEPTTTDVEDPLQPAMYFIDELLQLVEQNFGAWNSAEFKDLVSPSIPFTRSHIPPPYLTCF